MMDIAKRIMIGESRWKWIVIHVFSMAIATWHVADAEQPSGYPHEASTQMYRAPGLQLCRTLYVQSVRKRVGMREEDFVLLQDKISILSALLPTVKEFSDGTPVEREALLESIAKEADEIEPEVWSMVSRMLGREGIDKLIHIYIKYHGLKSLLNERIAERIRLSSEQKAKIKVAIDNLTNERSVILPRIAAGGGIEKAKVNELLILKGEAFDFVIRPILVKEQIAFLQHVDQYEITSSNGEPFARFSFGW